MKWNNRLQNQLTKLKYLQRRTWSNQPPSFDRETRLNSVIIKITICWIFINTRTGMQIDVELFSWHNIVKIANQLNLSGYWGTPKQWHSVRDFLSSRSPSSFQLCNSADRILTMTWQLKAFSLSHFQKRMTIKEPLAVDLKKKKPRMYHLTRTFNN